MTGDSEELARRRNRSTRILEAERRGPDEASAELAQIRAEAETLRARFGHLYDQVLETLQKHDPIGIAYVADEYSAEVETILLRLNQANNADDLRRVIWEEFVWWFGDSKTTWQERLADAEEIAGPEQKYDGIAREIWSLLESRRAPK